jgi:hypothetical protein
LSFQETKEMENASYEKEVVMYKWNTRQNIQIRSI